MDKKKPVGRSHMNTNVAFTPIYPTGYCRNKPLVVILNGRDCHVEFHTLRDVATVAFCDAKRLQDIHEAIFNEAFGVLMWHTVTFTKADLKRFKALKIIFHIGCGVDNIDVKGAGELGIAVCNAPEYAIEEVADTTLSLILNLYRSTYWFANMIKEGEIFKRPEQVREAFLGCARIRGSTLGLIGLGRIGKAVALRAKAFAFDVMFYDPNVSDGVDKSLGLVRAYSLKDLLSRSDCVSLHCTLNEGNRYMINEQSIRLMRPGSLVVNTAGGRLVNETALASALKSGQIRAAALDVHDNEPHNILEGPLKDSPNLICTPRSASYIDDNFKQIRQMAAQEIGRAITLSNIPHCLKHCVNKEYTVNIVRRFLQPSGFIRV